MAMHHESQTGVAALALCWSRTVQTQKKRKTNELRSGNTSKCKRKRLTVPYVLRTILFPLSPNHCLIQWWANKWKRMKELLHFLGNPDQDFVCRLAVRCAQSGWTPESDHFSYFFVQDWPTVNFFSYKRPVLSTKNIKKSETFSLTLCVHAGHLCVSLGIMASMTQRIVREKDSGSTA